MHRYRWTGSRQGKVHTGAIHISYDMTSLVGNDENIANTIQMYTATGADTASMTATLILLLTSLGDKARDETNRKSFGHHITSLLALLGHQPHPTYSILSSGLRALGNILIDHDIHRETCQKLNGVSILVNLLQLVASDSAGRRSPVCDGTIFELERNVLGALGNLVCDNRMLQEHVINAGAVPLIQHAAVASTSRQSRIMACNAALCLEHSTLLSDIAFHAIDNLKICKGISDLDLNVVSTAVEGLVDLVDEDGVALQDMKSSGKRQWVDDIVALAVLVLNGMVADNTEDTEHKDHVAKYHTSEAHATCLHNLSGLLSRSFKIQGPQSFQNMSRHSLQTLGQVVANLAKFPAEMFSAPSSPYPELMGIFTGSLCSVCADFDGCMRVLGAGAERGVMAAASLRLAENKAIQSAGLVGLRNLSIACHQMTSKDDTHSSITEFLAMVCTVSFNMGCINENTTLSLSGVAALRQALGNNFATLNIMEQFFNKIQGEERWDWLLHAFTQEGMAEGNKGQCECSRIVCIVVGKYATREFWERFGSTQARREAVNICANRLATFQDETVRNEASLCIKKIQEFI